MKSHQVNLYLAGFSYTKLVAPFYICEGEKKYLEKIEISLVQSNSAVPYDVRSVILQFFSIRCNNASACA